MEFIAYNKSQLLALVNSDAFKQMEHLPMSTYRAISHTNNPRLQDNDPLLYMAYQDGEMIGYLGAMPDESEIGGKVIRSAYLSSLWVSPKHRGKEIGSRLVEKMTLHYPFSLLTEYVEPTKPVYDKTGIYQKAPIVKEGIRIYFRFILTEIVTQKKPSLKRFKFLLKIADSLLNFGFRLLPSTQQRLPKHIKVEEVQHFSSEMIEFIRRNKSSEFLHQRAEKFNWILNFPWIQNSADSAEEERKLNNKYYFSSYANDFRNIVLVGRNDQEQIQFVLFLTKRDGRVKLPYAYFNHNVKEVAETILNWLQKENITLFTCFHPEISAQLFQFNFRAAFKNKIRKKTLISKKLMAIVPSDFQIQDGEGDSVFT